MDGAQDSPLERLGRRVEVEGRLEVGKESMTGWSQVRRKKGQVETDVVAGSRGREEYQTKKGQVEMDVVAGSRGWEEYRRKFPHLAHGQRHMSEERWKGLTSVSCWLRGSNLMESRERREIKSMSEAQKKEVETWLRGGGGQGGGDE